MAPSVSFSPKLLEQRRAMGARGGLLILTLRDYGGAQECRLCGALGAWRRRRISREERLPSILVGDGTTTIRAVLASLLWPIPWAFLERAIEWPRRSWPPARRPQKKKSAHKNSLTGVVSLANPTGAPQFPRQRAELSSMSLATVVGKSLIRGARRAPFRRTDASTFHCPRTNLTSRGSSLLRFFSPTVTITSLQNPSSCSGSRTVVLDR